MQDEVIRKVLPDTADQNSDLSQKRLLQAQSLLRYWDKHQPGYPNIGEGDTSALTTQEIMSLNRAFMSASRTYVHQTLSMDSIFSR